MPADHRDSRIFRSESAAARGSYQAMDEPEPEAKAAAWPERPRRLFSARAALGTFGVVAVVGGTLLSLGVLAFLFYLWLGEGPDDGARSQAVWRRIVVGEVLGPTVTIASAVLRVVIATQALVGTSLLAAVVLERHGVPLAFLAEVSVLRCENSGPFRLVSLFLSSRSFLWRTKAAFVLALVLLVGAVASQFTSTLLVSDLSIFALVGDAAAVPVGAAVNLTNARFDYPMALSFPPAFTPFGEVAGPANSTAPTAAGLSDTGPVQRLYLPLADANRTVVRSYRGKAIVMSSRFVCMRPQLVGAGIDQIPGDFPDSTIPGLPAFTGNISYTAALSAAGLDPPPDCPDAACFSTSFNCSLPFVAYPAPPMYSACWPDRDNVRDTPLLVNTTGPLTNYSMAVLVLRSNVTDKVTQTLQGFTSLPAISAADGEFVTWELVGIKISASLCFQTLGFTLVDAAVSADRDLAAPLAEWNQDTQQYQLDAPTRLLGVSADGVRQNASARGLYHVEAVANATTPDFVALLNQGVILLSTEVFGVDSINTLLSTLALGSAAITCSIQNQAVFEIAMAGAGRVALALQGLMTTMAAVHINNIIPLLTNATDATVVPSVLVLAPGRWRGLLAATAILFTSLATTAIITVLFLVKTRYSTINNYWNAVSQVYSDETKWIIDGSADVRDPAVTKMVGDGVDANMHVQVARSFTDIGRVQAVPFRRSVR